MGETRKPAAILACRRARPLVAIRRCARSRGNLAHDEQAIEWCNKAAVGLPQVFLPLFPLASANAWAGHDKEAKEAAAQLQKVFPGFTVQAWADMYRSDDPTFNARFQRFNEGLRKAGVPEGDKKTN